MLYVWMMPSESDSVQHHRVSKENLVGLRERECEEFMPVPRGCTV